MRVVKIIPFFMLCVAAQSISVDIGSDTAVTRFNTRQLVENGDRIAGFAAIAAGFSLAGFGVTGTFDTFFPVIGPVFLGFGNLILNQDLIFHALSNISKLGNIIGQGHTIELSSNMSCIPSGFGASCTISFLDAISTADEVFSVDWSSTDTLLAIGMKSNGGNELQVYSWNGATLASITGVDLGNDANAVRWHPTKSWIAIGRKAGGGNELFLYSLSGSTLTLLDSIDVANNVTDVAWDPSGDFLAVAKEANNELFVYDMSAGTFGASVSVNLAQNANAVSWNTTGGFLAVGTNANGGGAELFVYSFSTGPLTLTLNASAEIGVTVNTIDWNKGSINTDIIAIGVPGTNALRLFRHATGSLTSLTLSLAVGTAIRSVHWNQDGACLAAGLLVNAAAGELRTYLFDDDDLSEEADEEIGFDTFAVRWSRNGKYLADGSKGKLLGVYQLDSAFVDVTNVIFSDVTLLMNSNLTLRETSITFNGECTIDGSGGVLTLAPTFSLILGEQSSILLKDILIEGIAPEHIRGLDEQSTFSLQNATFVLDEDFTFSIGRLDILSDFKIAGPNNVFIYSSDQQSIIRGGFLNPDDECSPFYSGALILDDDVTFSYAPASNSATLLNLESQYSTIFLNGGNLFANSLTLTKGRLQVDGESTLQAGTSISFGDGIAANNLVVNILPAASLNIIGTLINNNI